MDNNSNDLFSDDEHFWMGNEEDELDGVMKKTN